MTDDAALRISRKAVEEARSRVGVDKKILESTLESRIEVDPQLLEAFAQAGRVFLEAQQETNH